jgi:hypothetical protein
MPPHHPVGAEIANTRTNRDVCHGVSILIHILATTSRWNASIWPKTPSAAL